MHSNMLCGFYQNTDPKSSFTYCFIISYSIDELYYILYVKGGCSLYYCSKADIEKHCVDGLLVSGTRKMVYETICALDTMLNYQA